VAAAPLAFHRLHWAANAASPQTSTGRALDGHDVSVVASGIPPLALGHDVSAVASGSNKFYGITALDGKLFAAPFSSDKILEFDPRTRSITGHDVSAIASGSDKFRGITALDGKLFAAPINSDKILEFDPRTRSITGHDVSAVASGYGKFHFITALDGKLFAAPFTSSSIRARAPSPATTSMP